MTMGQQGTDAHAEVWTERAVNNRQMMHVQSDHWHHMLLSVTVLFTVLTDNDECVDRL